MANIISLTIENFRSYKNQTTFSFEAVDAPQLEGNYHIVELKDGRQIRLLNTAVIYGANAAGKSNVIIALWALYSFVKYSRERDPGEGIKYEPYVLSAQTKKSPISLEIRFVAEGVVYIYSYSYNHDAFLSEKLRQEKGRKKIIVFERDEQGVTRFNPSIFHGKPDEMILKNHLALSELSLKADAIIQSVYRELSSMQIVPLIDEYNRPKDAVKEIAVKELAEEPDCFFSKTLKELIVSADTGITNVLVNEFNKENFNFPESVPEQVRKDFIQNHKYEILMVHPSEEGEEVSLPLNVESAGTQTLFKAGARVLRAIEQGGLLAYDEMNVALHPRLFRRLVELFNNHVTNPYGAQLLVTTHDVTLMVDNLLRADQIWFAQKDNGISELYSAVDFDSVSIDQSFEAWYRAGRLEGLPRMKPFVPKVGQKLNVEEP